MKTAPKFYTKNEDKAEAFQDANMFAADNDVRRKFDAGRATAIADAKHGMTREQMVRVLETGRKCGDNEHWSAGYSRGIYEVWG